MSTHVRLNHFTGAKVVVDEAGSTYITQLNDKLKHAEKLAREVATLNPSCLSLGAGKMAYLQELAKQLLQDES